MSPELTVESRIRYLRITLAASEPPRMLRAQFSLRVVRTCLASLPRNVWHFIFTQLLRGAGETVNRFRVKSHFLARGKVFREAHERRQHSSKDSWKS